MVYIFIYYIYSISIIFSLIKVEAVLAFFDTAQPHWIWNLHLYGQVWKKKQDKKVIGFVSFKQETVSRPHICNSWSMSLTIFVPCFFCLFIGFFIDNGMQSNADNLHMFLTPTYHLHTSRCRQNMYKRTFKPFRPNIVITQNMNMAKSHKVRKMKYNLSANHQDTSRIFPHTIAYNGPNIITDTHRNTHKK
jgi:hypothetical protein